MGPTLAAQFGYLPGTLWIIIGAVLGGAVQDFVILFASMRRDGKSLGQMAREEIGKVGGFTALLTVLLIMIILLAVVALVVVNALRDSPWVRYDRRDHADHAVHGPHRGIGGRVSAGAPVIDSAVLAKSAGIGIAPESIAPISANAMTLASRDRLRFGWRAAIYCCWLPRDYRARSSSWAWF